MWIYPCTPQAKVLESTKEKVTCVPSNQLYQVNTVVIDTNATSGAILEFYKGMLPGIRIADFGSYWGIEYVPEGWEKGDRIEIQVSKDTNSDLPGYDVKQFRKMLKEQTHEVSPLHQHRGNRCG